MISVLVVDDDFMVARLHSTLVERVPGFTVAGVAHSGTEALSAVRELRPDLVLLDIYLPDMPGLEVLRELRGGETPERGSDVLVITAARDPETVLGAQRGGAVQYIIKPFEGEELRERLLRYARDRRDIDALTAPRQEDVDRVFGGAGTLARRPAGASGDGSNPLPKGLTALTADLVRAALDSCDAGDTLSASECAQRSGLSRVSARRYLEHFVATGEAAVTLRYGTTGRPERRYRRASPEGWADGTRVGGASEPQRSGNTG